MINSKPADLVNSAGMIIERPSEENRTETVTTRKERTISPRLEGTIKKPPARKESLEDVAPSPTVLPNGLDTLNDRESVFEQTLLNTQAKPITSQRTAEEQTNDTGVFAREAEVTSPVYQEAPQLFQETIPESQGETNEVEESKGAEKA